MFRKVNPNNVAKVNQILRELEADEGMIQNALKMKGQTAETKKYLRAELKVNKARQKMMYSRLTKEVKKQNKQQATNVKQKQARTQQLRQQVKQRLSNYRPKADAFEKMTQDLVGATSGMNGVAPTIDPFKPSSYEKDFGAPELTWFNPKRRRII